MDLALEDHTIVVGWFGNGGNAKLDVGAGEMESSGYDVFVARYDQSGAALWSERYGDSDQQIVFDSTYYHTLNGAERIAIVGSTTFAQSVPETGAANAFLIVLDGDGDVIFEREIGGPGNETAHGVAFDRQGNVLVTGTYQTDSPNATQHGMFPVSFEQSLDLFVVKYDRSGKLVWASGWGNAGEQIGSAIGADGSGEIYVTGTVTGELALESGPLLGGDSDTKDIFLMKLEP